MIISRQENLEYIKDQPDFLEFDDPDELLKLIGPAWINDPGIRPRDGWSSAVRVISCGVGMGNATGFQYGGIVPMIGCPDDRYGLNSWSSIDHLRALHAERDGEPWTTLILSYRDDTGEFGHELNVTNFRVLSAEVTITTSDIDDHQAELDALPTPDVTWY